MRPARPLPITVILATIGMIAGCQQVDRNGLVRSRSRADDAVVGRRQAANVQVAMGRTAEFKGDLDTAMAAYNEALKNDPHRADANQRLAVVHDRLGRFQESAAYYARALAESPGDAEIFCDKGYSFYLQRRWAEADVCLRQAIALKPKLERAHNNLGLVLARNGRLDEALAEFHAAGCQAAEAHQNLAFVLSTEGRLDEARHQYELALAANPSATTARERLAELGKVSEKIREQGPAPRQDEQVLTASYNQTPPPTASPKSPRDSWWSRRRRARSNGSMSAKGRDSEPIESPR